MKLFELIQPTMKHTNLNKGQSAGDIRADISRSKNTELLGSGRHAEVYAQKTRPNSVLKVVTLKQFESDPIIQYLKKVSQDGRSASNPYFPRVYRMHTFKQEQGEDMVVIEMEKLVPYQDVSSEELIAIGNKAIHNFEQKLKTTLRNQSGINYGPKVSNPSKKVDIARNNQEIAHILTNELFNSILSASPKMKQDKYFNTYAGRTTNIIDPLLKQALMLLKSFMRGMNAGNDISSTNVMFRRGLGGTQLVLTDPIG